MSKRDEFDPEGFQSAFGKIADAMEQSRSGMRERGPMIAVLTVAVALFVLFAVFWSTYPRGGSDQSSGPAPLIRADNTPYKVAPDDPGGMEIPYRDSTIFETIRDAKLDEGNGKVESLLPAPEEPMAREQMFAGLKTEPIDGADTESGIPPLDAGPVAPTIEPGQPEHEGTILPEAETQAPAPEPTPAPKATTPTKPAVTTTDKTMIAEDDKPVETVTKTEPASGNETITKSTATGTHYVQLGSVKDRSGANGEWSRLQKDFPAQLGGLTLRVQEADLGDKGKFYRIQGGAVDQAKAKEICAVIAAKRAGGCLVVAR